MRKLKICLKSKKYYVSPERVEFGFKGFINIRTHSFAFEVGISFITTDSFVWQKHTNKN